MNSDEKKSLQARKSALSEFLKKHKADITENLIEVQPVGSPAPVSFGQESLWILDKMGAGAASNIAVTVYLTGDLEITVLENSLEALVNRHHILKSSFSESINSITQVVDTETSFDMGYVDLSGLGEVEQEETLQEIIRSESTMPFDLVNGPVFRARLLRRSQMAHVLVIALHHIVWDGWSGGVFWRELGELYKAFIKGYPSPLEPLPLQYADFAAWQRKWIARDAIQNQLAYWRTQLADAPVCLNLATDRVRPSVQTYTGRSQPIVVPPAVLMGLNELAKQTKTSLFMILVAVYHLLLARYSGQNDICIGTPVANRNRSDFDGLIGYFVNSVVLRTCSAGNPTFAQLLTQVQATLAAAFRHQDVPLEQVIEMLKPERRAGFSPLFQAMLVLNRSTFENLELPGLSLQLKTEEATAAKYDLTLSMVEANGELFGNFEYRSDLFDTTTVKRMANYFIHALQAIVEDPQALVSRLIMLTGDEELHELLHLSGTSTDDPFSPIQHLFEQQVNENPNKIALVFDQQRWTYAELNARANQLAGYLVEEKQVKPETLVGVFMERSGEMIIAILAILKAGGAYVPLDPHYPIQRLVYMQEDAGLEIVITSIDLLDRASPIFARVFPLDAVQTREQLAKYPVINLLTNRLGLSSRNLAYVIYTSGSTGLPKGVAVEHRGLCNLVDVQKTVFNVSAESRILQFASISFDASVWEIVMALGSGASLIVARRDDLLTGQPLTKTLQNYAITHVTLPSLVVASLNPEVLPQLRYLILAGDVCPAPLAARWSAYVNVFNAYGPTEATVCASIYACNGAERTRVPIGRPISNTQIYLLDMYLQPVPIGVAGECHIGGVGLARGYLHRTGLNAEQFIANPFYRDGASDCSEQLYKTGDLMRRLPDGNLEFIGRIDDQVKIRGFRIEIGEIESALRELPSVRNSVVVVSESTTKEKRLIAYVEVRDKVGNGRDADIISELRQQLSKLLPDFMVPGVFVLLSNLPLTLNGKIDRKALPEPELIDHENDYIPPRSMMEKLLCRIWQEILNVERVGSSDNFFQLGGHSLLVAQVMSRLKELGIAVTANQVLGSTNLADLAARLETNSDNKAPSFLAPANLIREDCLEITPAMLPLMNLTEEEINSIVRRIPGGTKNIQDIYPLGPLQEGILFHHQMSREGDPYVFPSLFKLDRGQSVEEFVVALQGIVNRHDMLRTAIIWEELSLPVQVVLRQANLPVRWVELDGDQDCLAHMQARCAPEAQTMDLTLAPLLHLEIVFDANSAQHYVLLRFHHIISDHVGLEIIRRELAYFLVGRDDQLPDPVPYREFVAHALHLAQSNDPTTHFQKVLGDIQDPTAPFNLVNVHGDGSRIVEKKGALSSDLSLALRRQAKQLKVSSAAMFHVVWALVVANCSNRDDVVFGTVVSGRLQGTTSAENMLGVLINTLPLRVKMTNQSALEIVHQVQESLFELLHYEQVSLSAAQRCTSLPSTTPLFSALLNYRHSATIQKPSSTDAVDVSRSPPEINFELLAGQERTNYPFGLTVDDLGRDFEFSIKVDKSINAERILGYVQTATASLIHALETSSIQPVNTLPILPDIERQTLVEAWNDTAADYPKKKCLHELFEAYAEHNPQAIALVFEKQILSYSDLNGKANQLAHFLIDSRQVKPDVLVGICMDRSIDMIVAILGVLKSGGAYVPLDPNYPAARLEYIVEEANLGTILVQTNLLQNLPFSGAKIVCVDHTDLQNSLAARATNNIPSQNLQLNSTHLAYVIYTSGSTGNPKGVMIEHHSVVNLVFNIQSMKLAEAGEQWGWSASFAFDASVKGISQLLIGVPIHIIAEKSRQDPYLLADKLGDLAVIDCTPMMVEMWFTAGIDHKLPNLIIGGEPIGSRLWKRLVEWQARSNKKAVNVYGPTECTVDSHFCEISGERPHIGKPLCNVQAFLLNSSKGLVSTGVSAELYIGGHGLARGYLKRPELSAEKFVPNPFYDTTNPASGALLYKTGDLARWLPDGNLEFVGRVDHQVKIRGFRIELGEIENALRAHKEVKDAVVLAKESAGTGGKRLIAYVVTDSVCLQDSGEASLNLHRELMENLGRHLSKILPDYMVPSVFVSLKQLPLTPNGKVDRKALPEPDMSVQQATYVAPSTETEKILCHIWEEVLGVERVGLSDNFFTLGGHSLLIMKVISRLQLRNRTLSARQIFSTPILADLAVAVDEQAITQAPLFKAPANCIPDDCKQITPEMLPLVNLSAEEIARIVGRIPGGARNVQDIYPLGPLQEGILFQHMMSSQCDPYVLPFLFKYKNREAVTRYMESLQFIINRHDVLRTAILWSDLSTPVQVVCRETQLAVRWLELEGDVEAQMRSRCAPDQQRLDLGRAPLLQLQIAVDARSQEHFVLLQFHHIISDHVGLEIIQKEMECYEKGLADSLPPPFPYREFVAHAQYQGLHHDADAYFKNTLGDVEESTAPFDLLDVNGDGSRIVEARAVVPADTSIHIRALAKTFMVSPASLFHAAWAMVVSSCSGRDDVVFGTVLSGRLQGTLGAENMLGLFINTLPLRVKLSKVTAVELIKQVHRSLLDLLPYEQASLTLAQKCSSVPRGLPLFSAMLNYRHSTAFEDESMGVGQEKEFELLAGQERTNYPFNLSVDDLGQQHGFRLGVQVDNSVDANRVIGYIQTAIAALVDALESSSAQAMNTVSILSKEERQQLLVECNRNVTDSSKNKCIHELFETQADRNPDAIAVVFENQQLSYGELNARANQLAHYLIIEKQVKPDSLVGICVERSLEMVVGILGILKAGGAYVPLDPEYPEARLSYMLSDAKLTTVLTQCHLRGTAPVSDVQAVCLDAANIQQELQRQPTQNPDTRGLGLTSRHLAYVIYTSGSTGNPKGVMVEHFNVTHLMDAAQHHFEFTANDVWTLFHSYAFDFSVWELWGAIAWGGRLVIVPYLVSRSPGDFYELLIREKVTVLNQTPSAFKALIPEDAQRNASLALRYVVFGGEALNLASLGSWFDRHGDQQPQLINMYGITETTVHVTHSRITRELVAGATGVSVIGKPLADLQLLILNGQNKLVPIGVAGEMYVGGAGVTRGYLNQSSLTEKRFVLLPEFGEQRFYRTGDLARYLENGQLAYIGRIDHQVKIRGFRIELGEVEHALASHAAVKDVIVLVTTSARGDKRLVAYAVTDAVDITDDSEEVVAARYALVESLRQHLHTTLPDYMVPSVFVLLDTLPLTPNGKVDRNALPEPDVSQQQLGYVAPRTETEVLLCEIWQDVLGVERVGVTDNFFQLGGHSLLVIQLVTEMQKNGIDLLVKEVMLNPTIEGISDCIKNQKNNTAEHSYVKTKKMSTLPNKQLLFKSTFRHHWNMAEIINITNASPYFLEKSLTEIFSRHEGLRHTFYVAGDGLVCANIATLPVKNLLEVIVIENTYDVDEVSKIIENHASNFQKTINLENNLFKFVLFKCPNGMQDRFLWIIHHALIDGYSINIFYEELLLGYLSGVAGLQYDPLPTTTSMVEWGNRLYQYVNSNDIQQDIEYWTSRPWNKIGWLMDYPEGVEKNKSENTDLYGSDIVNRKKLCLAYSERLNKASVTGKYSTADILFLAFSVAISTVTKSDYVLFEIVANGREKIVRGVDLGRAIGWTVDYVPVMVNVNKMLNIEDQLKSYNQQYNEIPNFGLTFNALRHFSESPEVRKQINTIPRAEFNVNYTPPAMANYAGKNSDRLPFHLVSKGTENPGELNGDKLADIIWPTYIHIGFREGEFVFTWIARNNIYTDHTIELAMSLWLQKIKDIVDYFEHKI